MLDITKVCIIFLYLISISLCLPPHRRRLSDQEFDRLVQEQQQQRQQQHPQQKEENPPYLEELGIEYTRYLQQVIETLEKDEQFKKKLETADENDIKTAKIADELEYVNHHVRSKLDELKRTELERLKELAKQAYATDNAVHVSPPGHIDHENPNTFEVKDFKKLINKVALDLEEADRKRKEMFKEYEMQKHFEREETLKNMTEEQRKEFLLTEEEEKKKEMEAKKRVHHPGSKQQLQEVWEKQDHMNKNDFNPRTFFAMHDVDGNGFLDEDEVKMLFLKELDKLYAQGMPHADLMERAEEMERMREHVFQEMDRNRDRLISWQEFHAMSLRPEFNEDPGWETLDDRPVYSPEELAAFEKQRREEIEYLIKAGKLKPPYPHPYNAPDNHLGNEINDTNAKQIDLDEYYKQRRQQELNEQLAQQANQQYHPGQQFAQPVNDHQYAPQAEQYAQQAQPQFAQQPQQQFAQPQNQQFAPPQYAQQPQVQQYAQQPQPQQYAQPPAQPQQFAQQPQPQPVVPNHQSKVPEQPVNKFQPPAGNAVPLGSLKDNAIPKQPFEQHPNNVPKNVVLQKT